MAASSSLSRMRKAMSSLVPHSRRLQRHCITKRTMVHFVDNFEVVPRHGKPVNPGDPEPAIPGIGKYKTSTGLVGLDVEPEWYNKLMQKHQHLLDKMEQSDMPETAAYRISITKWSNFTMKMIEANPEDPEGVEEACRMGQVEEMIEQADDEMEVLDMYLESRIWELVEEANPKMTFNPDPNLDPFDEEHGDPEVAEAIRDGVESMTEDKK